MLQFFCILFGFVGLIIGGEYADEKIQPATGPQTLACLGCCLAGAGLGVNLVLIGALLHPWICVLR